MSIACQECPLRKRRSFQAMSDLELSFINEFKVGELELTAGSSILSAGARCPHLYTVLSGAGIRIKMLPDGRRQIINFIFPGDLIGLQSGLLEKMTHGAEATTDMVLCVFRRSRLADLFRNHPSQAYDLTWLAASETATLGNALLSIGRRGARERISYLLNYIMERAEQSGFADAPNSTRFPFRQQDVADASGLSLVHTNKMIQDLRGDGLIKLAEGRLTVLDRDRLRESAVISEDEEICPVPRPLL